MRSYTVQNFFLATSLLTLNLIASVSIADVSVQCFQSWKTSRVDEARTAIEKMQGERSLVSQTASLKGAEKKTIDQKADQKNELNSRLQAAQKTGRVDQKLQQAQLNLEVAQELTVNDYFLLYLNQFKSKEAFIEVAKKLNPEETAELMLSYQKHLATGSRGYEDVVSGSGLTASPTPILKSN